MIKINIWGKEIIFLSLLMLVCIHVTAQHTVKLVILEKGTNQPVISANIAYAGNEKMENPVYTVTGRDGVALLTMPRADVCYFRVTSVGLLPLSGKMDPDTKALTLYMEEDVMGLNEVVVTGSRTARPMKLSPVATQVLSGQSLVNAGYGNLQQALQQETPGLNIQKVGFGSEISMQGLDARHVLFLMDGERMTGDMAGNLDYERFNLHAIERIEIVKGASSTLYGSRAAGAVINLITKKTVEPLRIETGLRYGQMNECDYKEISKRDFLYMFEKNADRPNLQSWLSAGAKSGKFTSQTDVWYSSSDGFYLYQEENDQKVYTKEANPFLDEDIVLKSYYPRPPMGIEGSEHVSASQKLYWEPTGNIKMQVYGSLFFMNTYDLIQDLVFSQSRDYTGGFKASYALKDWFAVTIGLHSDFYDRFKRHERRDERQKVYKSRIVQPRLTLTSSYFKGHDLIFGIEHFTDDLTSDRFVNRKMTTRSLKETEYFLQDEWTINTHWMLSAGARTNFSRVFGFMGMPKIAAKYSPNEQWSFRTNFSMGYRSPSIKELFFNWDHLGMFQIKGNEYLQPEKNNYFSFGSEYSNRRLFLSGTLYGNYFRNKIEGVWHVYDMQYNFEYTNLSRQRLLGGEAMARWHAFDFLTFNATYSYVDVSKRGGVQISTSSPHAATAGLEYRLKKQHYQLAGGLTLSYMGEKKFDVQDRVYVASEGRSRDAYFRCELPAYALLNASVSQTFHNKVKITLGVDNIFNYQPKTLGSGVTMFNVPATAGTRGHIQVEVMVDDIIRAIKREK